MDKCFAPVDATLQATVNLPLFHAISDAFRIPITAQSPYGNAVHFIGQEYSASIDRCRFFIHRSIRGTFFSSGSRPIILVEGVTEEDDTVAVLMMESSVTLFSAHIGDPTSIPGCMAAIRKALVSDNPDYEDPSPLAMVRYYSDER